MQRETPHAPGVHVGDENLLLRRVEPHAVRVAEAIMKKRGIFKTMVVRTDKGAQTLDFSPDEIAEIEYRTALRR